MNLRHLHYFATVAACGSVARASRALHLTPQTISEQIRQLEADLGTTLLRRAGRGLELTDAGRSALGYANEIFALESELERVLRSTVRDRPTEFRVGVADALPKSLAYRLLEPARTAVERIRIVCLEWRLTSLLDELAAHRLDLVLADAPLPSTADVRAFNHRLGESSLTFFAGVALAGTLDRRFPDCLDGAPLLLPSEDSPIRARVLRWLQRRHLRPHIVGEFDGSSLMAAYCMAGGGVMVAPTVLRADLLANGALVALGEADGARAEYFAISVERRVRHPCVRAIAEAARDHLFGQGPASRHQPTASEETSP